MPYVNTIERYERERAVQEGQMAAKQETARNLIKLGVLSDEQIAEATDLPLAEVQALRVEDKH